MAGSVALGNPENYTIGGMRFYFSENVSGNTPVAITAVSIANKTITLTGDLLATVGKGSRITVTGSTGNDGTYDVVSAVLDTGNTKVTVVQTIPDATADGDGEVTRNKELYLGNVVTGSFQSEINFLDHFTAKTGTRTKDRSIVQEISVTINLTMDEPNVDAMNLFMLGGTVSTTAGPPQIKSFKPFTNTERNGGARLAGVSDSGNEWIWTIYRSTLKPDGEFAYNDQDWSQFSFILEVLDNSSEDATTPFGTMDHYGVDQDIDNEAGLLPNN
jgi:hypothetical protein